MDAVYVREGDEFEIVGALVVVIDPFFVRADPKRFRIVFVDSCHSIADSGIFCRGDGNETEPAVFSDNFFQAFVVAGYPACA